MKNKAFKLCALTLAIYLILGVVFYFAAGDSLFYTSDTTRGISGNYSIGLEKGNVDTIEQTIYCAQDELEIISMTVFQTDAGESVAETVTAKIYSEGKEEILREVKLSTADVRNDVPLDIVCDPPIENAKNKKFVLELSVDEGNAGFVFRYGNAVSTLRADVAVEITEEEAMKVNGELYPITAEEEAKQLYSLEMDVMGINRHLFGEIYWFVYAGGALLLAAFLVFIYRRHQKGKNAPGLGVVKSLNKYSFLIHQLVSRDFKTKYKRSVLGMLWSFLNPLLTMSVQYLVFSYLFKSDIENFVVYLLTGIVCYNFFNEATNMCLMSIVGNSTLISKVYVPKYIYPFSRSLSSCINLLLALIPLFACCIITKTPITWAILIIPFVLLMLFLLSYGIGLILATLMVFFRDTQFLWGIVTMILMYLTPIFYPETIIPDRFMAIYKLNPLYHILRFMRSILIDGVSLEPKAYLICAALCIIPFIVGVIIFRKNEDKFVLNI